MGTTPRMPNPGVGPSSHYGLHNRAFDDTSQNDLQLTIPMTDGGDLDHSTHSAVNCNRTDRIIHNNNECCDRDATHAPQTDTGTSHNTLLFSITPSNPHQSKDEILVGLPSGDAIVPTITGTSDQINSALDRYVPDHKSDSGSHLPQPKAVAISRGRVATNPFISFDHYDVGEFTSTLEWHDKVPNCSKIVTDFSFGPSSREYWGGLLAMTMLDMLASPDNTLRLDSRVHNVLRNRFRLTMNTWLDTTLYNVGVSWIRFPSDDTSFNFGVFTRGGETSPAFKEIPVPGFDVEGAVAKVFVALSGFDVHQNWRLATTQTNISKAGFRINLNLIEPKDKQPKATEGALYSAKAIWIATTLPNVFVGEFEGNANGWEGYVHFPPHEYENPPALFTGISQFHLDPQPRFRVRVTTTPFAAGFTWSIRTWADSTLNKIRVQYIAIFN